MERLIRTLWYFQKNLWLARTRRAVWALGLFIPFNIFISFLSGFQFGIYGGVITAVLSVIVWTTFVPAAIYMIDYKRGEHLEKRIKK